jgi:hypothetical protein
MPVNGKHQNAKMPKCLQTPQKAKRRSDVKISKNIIFSKGWNIKASKMPKNVKIAKCQNIGNHAKMSAKCRIHKRQKTFQKYNLKDGKNGTLC